MHIHDALRKLIGPKADLAAFVSNQGAFQCNMLINSERTDPDYLQGNTGSVEQFARELQGLLGICDVVPNKRRVDVIFRDRTCIQLALGAAKSSMGGVTAPAHINEVSDWHHRNRLRISLGYDEELFLKACNRFINIAARSMEKTVYNYLRYSPLLSQSAELAAMYEKANYDLQAVAPPLSYWLAHGYALSRAYHCRHYQDVYGTVMNNFARYYGEFPFDNPYCPGEDLNTIGVVQWVCEAWKSGGIGSVDEIAVGTIGAEEGSDDIAERKENRQ